MRCGAFSTNGNPAGVAPAHPAPSLRLRVQPDVCVTPSLDAASATEPYPCAAGAPPSERAPRQPRHPTLARPQPWWRTDGPAPLGHPPTAPQLGAPYARLLHLALQIGPQVVASSRPHLRRRIERIAHAARPNL